MKFIGSYTVVEELFVSDKILISRCQEDNTQESVILKTSRNEYPSLAELASFRNHYYLTRDLTIPGVIRALKLEALGRGYALILEDVGAISLSNYLKQARLNLDHFFGIARQLVTILGELHHRCIIHRDIKPANILIHPDTGDIYLTDFSIASRLPREVQMLCSPNRLEGSLPYLSPEQTGRMNRSIDYRSDFYALGVSFFELLTGQLPFQEEDPIALIHCHMAVQPSCVSTHNPAVPSVLSALVAKLMAKNPEGRYQSVTGLQADLEACQTRWQRTGQIESLELGQLDISDRFSLPETLYGRDREVSQLLGAFERVAQGQRELMLVSGHSGVGKTAVVNEVHKPIVRQRGYFIRGKFDQFQRVIPLSAFAQGLSDLTAQLLSESSEAISLWKVQILDIAGDNGQLLLDLIPQLASVLGPQPAVSELFGLAAQERFNQLLKTFIQIIATTEHPLVIFLDDLQWADSASLQFLQFLLSDPDVQYLLIIGAYRDNEVSPSHPLIFLQDNLQQQNVAHTLQLAPLQYDDLNQLVADTLSCSSALAAPLTELVFQKTEGSPFFATQFLQSLYNRQLLTYRHLGGHWQFDIAQVKALASNDNIITLMTQRLRQLPDTTQHILCLAACLGNQFDLVTLALVSDNSIWETADLLWPALEDGLLLPTSEVYRFFQGHEQTMKAEGEVVKAFQEDQAPQYRFLHDRVQQAAYALIPSAEQAKTHQLIGQRWFSGLTEQDREAHIFELVRHLNLGYAADAHGVGPVQTAQLNLMAARRAKASAAYESAITYCKTSQACLPDESWHQQPKLTFEVQFETLQVEFLLGHYEKSEAMAKAILFHLNEPLEASKIQDFLVRFYSAQNRMADAIQSGLQALEWLQINLSEDLPLQKAIRVLPLPTPDQVARLPCMTDTLQKMGLQILMNLCTPTYAGDAVLYRRVVFTMLQLCEQQGYAAPAAHAYVSYAMLLCTDAAAFDLGYQAGQIGLCLVERFQAKALMVKANLICNGQIHHWTQHLSHTLSGLEAGVGAGIEAQDLEFATYCLNFLFLHTYRTTASIEATVRYQAKFLALPAIQTYEQNTPLFYARIWHQYLLILTQDSDLEDFNPTQLVGPAFDEIIAFPIMQQMNARISLGAFFLAKTILAYTFDDYPSALRLAEDAADYLTGLSSTLAPLHNVYYSLALIAMQMSEATYACKDMTENTTETHVEGTAQLAQIEQNQQRLRQWAESAPMNYAHLYQLVEAEHYRLQGQTLAAMAAYDNAIALADTHDYVNDQALAYERAANFYLSLNKPIIAQAYGGQAYYAYARWGAHAKVLWMQTHDSKLLDPPLHHAVKPTMTGGGTKNHATLIGSNASEQLDLQALMQAARVISQTIHVDQLLATLLKVLRENTGAEKCTLILSQNNKLIIRAQSSNQGCQLLNQPIDSGQAIPLNLIHSVAHTLTVFLSHKAASEPRLLNEPYIQKHQPQSILCVPLLNQGSLIGLVYLENTLAAGVFTDERLEIIKLICAQAAISLENATLYAQEQQHQQVLRDKNSALEQAVQDLKSAKKQITHLNQDLEQKIKNRTAELVSANQTLQEQIYQRQQAQQQLKERKAQFASILNNLEEIVWSVSAQTGQTFYLNPVAEKVYGRPLQELIAYSKPWQLSLHPEDKIRVEQQFSCLLEKGEIQTEYRIIRPNGEACWLTNFAKVNYDDEHQPIRIDYTLSDITAYKQAENKLIYDAMHDKLTGLPNRTLITERAEQRLQRTYRNPDHKFSLLFIDFDRFKVVNDSLGHRIGDRLLIFCAQVLKKSVRSQDTVARIGGDEFVILLDSVDDENHIAIEVAQRIQLHFQGEILIDDHTIFTSASIGIVLGSADYTQVSDLFQDADIAMYRAKANGRACHEVFSPAMRTQALEVLHTGNDLRLAIERNQLVLYYQPIVSLSDLQCTGYEALIRWQHPERGLLLPEQFLPIALDSDLMEPLGFWVLCEACRQMGEWTRIMPQFRNLKINVNVSEQLICSPDFLELMNESLSAAGLSPQSLSLELVEATLMNENGEVSQILNQLWQQQVNIAVDDFGTGYSSLSYLRRFPISEIKIDRSFIREINDNSESLEITRTIITLAKILGKIVIAEGIETQGQLEQLIALGCDLGQGFLFCRPCPAEAVEPIWNSL